MTKFSIKNIFAYWLKMWPMTLVLLVLGTGAGVVAMKSVQQSYATKASVLVVNTDTGVTPADYVGIMNSRILLDRVDDEFGVGGDDCTLQSTGSGNVLAIVATCSSSKDNSELMVSGAISVFTDKVKELYGNNNDISVTNLSGDLEAVETVGKWDYIARIAMPIVAALLISGVVAFVRFDYVNSKQRK